MTSRVDGDAAPGPSLEELLQFLYLMPVGVLESDEGGHVEVVNPAAARLLAPALGAADLTDLHAVLARLDPDLLADLTGSAGRTGAIGADRRHVVATSLEHDLHVELSAVRVAAGRIMLAVVDVSLERQLAEREQVEMLDFNDGILQDLIASQTALDLGDARAARAYLDRAVDAGRARLGRQLGLLGTGGVERAVALVRAERDARVLGGRP